MQHNEATQHQITKAGHKKQTHITQDKQTKTKQQTQTNKTNT